MNALLHRPLASRYRANYVAGRIEVAIRAAAAKNVRRLSESGTDDLARRKEYRSAQLARRRVRIGECRIYALPRRGWDRRDAASGRKIPRRAPRAPELRVRRDRPPRGIRNRASTGDAQASRANARPESPMDNRC